MTPKNQELRDSLKQIEATITSALAHQPEDDAQCGQFLYDTIVSVFNIADLAAHTYRGVTTYCRPIAAAPAASPTPDGAAPSAPVPSVPYNTAKLREALLCIGHIAEYLEAGTVKDLNHAYRNIQDRVEIALAEPPRNCDVGTVEEQKARLKAYCASHGKDSQGAYRCENCNLLHEPLCELAWANTTYMEMSGEIKNESTTKPKVLVIDDAGFMRSYAQKFLDFCDVEQEYGIPKDETVLAKYDVLIVDGEGIGNSKYKDGIEFCKAYKKQGNNKGLIYHSGLLPDKCDREELEKKGIKSVLKGGFASDLVEAVQEVVLNPSSGKESK